LDQVKIGCNPTPVPLHIQFLVLFFTANNLTTQLSINQSTNMTNPTTKDDKQVASALAIRSVADNLIKRAFDLSQKEIIFQLPSSQPVHSSPSNAPDRHTEATVVSVSPKQTQFSNGVMASTFLDNEQWLMEVLKTLDPEKHCQVQPINTALKQRANQLQRQLEERLIWHCQTSRKCLGCFSLLS
jgi:hypothetical protein